MNILVWHVYRWQARRALYRAETAQQVQWTPEREIICQLARLHVRELDLNRPRSITIRP